MQKSKILFLSTLTTTLILSGCGGGETSEILTNNIQPHKVTRAYGDLDMSNDTYADVTVSDSKYFFKYGSDSSHIQVYIDSDLNTATGFTMFEDDSIGAEFLFEDNIIYKYTGTNNEWSWKKVSYANEKDDYYDARLSFDILGDSFAMQVVAIAGEDWNRAYISDKEVITYADAESNDEDIKLTITDDASNIYFLTKQEDNVKHFLYYLNSDQNRNSGYSTSGAEYLVEDDALYEYTGDGNSWSWKIKEYLKFEKSTTVKTTLPKSSITLGDKIGVKAYGLGNDWNWINEFDLINHKVSSVVGSERPFKIVVKTDNIGRSLDTEYSVLTHYGLKYSYNIDCNDDGIDEAKAVSSSYLCKYDKAGTYTISISGVFPGFYNSRNKIVSGRSRTDALKLISVKQWGTQPWKTMSHAFYGCVKLKFDTTDKPNLTNVTSMNSMFWGVFKEGALDKLDLASWDVSSVTSMANMFRLTGTFNQDISSWDVSNVTTMRFMFTSSKAFNQDIGSWDVSSVTDMYNMFNGAEAFNQDISSWNVSNVIDRRNMFLFASNMTESYKPKF